VLVHPEDDDVELESSTRETRSEEEEALDDDDSVLRLVYIIDGPEPTCAGWRS